MTKKLLFVLFLFAALVGAGNRVAHKVVSASPLSVFSETFTAGSLIEGTAAANEVGIIFDVGAAPITVTAIKVFNKYSSTNRSLRITNAAGTTIASATAVFNVGNDGTWVTVTLGSPVVLSASTTYAVVRNETESGQYLYTDDSVMTVLSSDITNLKSCYFSSGAPVGSVSNKSYGPTDIIYHL